MKITKTTVNLADRLCIGVYEEQGTCGESVIRIRDGHQPDGTVWVVYKVADDGSLVWWGQLGGHCLKPHQVRQVPLEIRDEKALRRLLKLIGGFALEWN